MTTDPQAEGIAEDAEEFSGEAESPLQGTSTLLLGGPGSGKTYSLASFLEAGKKLAIIFTEPRGPESLLAACEAKGLDTSKVFWRYISPMAPTWEVLQNNAWLISNSSYQALSEMKAGLNKPEYRQFIRLLETMSNFVDQRTGKELGPIDEFDTSWAFVLDSLSGLNLMAMDLVVGAKPAKHQGEWGVAMDNEERLIQKLCSDTKCFFVLTAHIERTLDEVQGGTVVTAGALGRKLAPKLPRFFSDVVHAYREGSAFFWSTTSDNMDLKMRNLPIHGKLQQDFGQVIAVWEERAALARKAQEEAQTDG